MASSGLKRLHGAYGHGLFADIKMEKAADLGRAIKLRAFFFKRRMRNISRNISA